MRKGRLLLALSAVQRALATAGAADPTAHCLVVRFALAAKQAQQQPTNGQARLFPVCKNHVCKRICIISHCSLHHPIIEISSAVIQESIP